MPTPLVIASIAVVPLLIGALVSGYARRQVEVGAPSRPDAAELRPEPEGRRGSRSLRFWIAVALLPLSAVPIIAVGIPKTLDAYESFSHRYLDRDALPAPATELTRAQRERWAPIPAYSGAIPTLAYHGINRSGDRWSVGQGQFAEQMAMLKNAGFHTVTIAQYARFVNGTDQELPSRPILVTFDDGRLDSFRGADAVLEKYGLQATMFVITGKASDQSRFYTHWGELKDMAASGRWDIQAHAGHGHRYVRVDARGNEGPFYAYHRYANGRLETFNDYKERVAGDIRESIAELKAHIPRYQTYAFAVPYGNYGQRATNDRRIPAFVKSWLPRKFDSVFVQSDREYTTERTPRWDLRRYPVDANATTDGVYSWLRSEAPRRNGG